MNAEPVKTLEAAKKQCEAKGMRLTPGRSRLLKALVETGEPRTAYELLEQVRVDQKTPLHPQTVYRALDFLLEAGLIHRIASTGQFMLCEHVQCNHSHRPSQFLVCDDCGSIAEIELDEHYLASFTELMQARGFRPSDNGVEIHGLCANCSYS